MTGPKTTRAIETVEAIAPLAETPSQKAQADRAMDQVEKIDGRRPGNPNLMSKITIDKARQARHTRGSDNQTAGAERGIVVFNEKPLKAADLPPDLAEEDARWREEMLAQHGRRAKPVLVKATVEPPRRPRMTAAERLAELERLAREHGADLSEEGFNEALGSVARHKPMR